MRAALDTAARGLVPAAFAPPLATGGQVCALGRARSSGRPGLRARRRRTYQATRVVPTPPPRRARGGMAIAAMLAFAFGAVGTSVALYGCDVRDGFDEVAEVGATVGSTIGMRCRAAPASADVDCGHGPARPLRRQQDGIVVVAAPYLALAHAGCRSRTKTILLDRRDRGARDREVNAAGRLPVLHHGDLVIWDSLAICEYAAELFPAAKLWPTDRARRARARSICAEMHAGFAALRQNMPMDLVAPARQGPHARGARRRRARRWRSGASARRASGGPFLFGAFTIADAMFAPVTTRFTTYGVDLDATCRALRRRDRRAARDAGVARDAASEG